MTTRTPPRLGLAVRLVVAAACNGGDARYDLIAIDSLATTSLHCGSPRHVAGELALAADGRWTSSEVARPDCVVAPLTASDSGTYSWHGDTLLLESKEGEPPGWGMRRADTLMVDHGTDVIYVYRLRAGAR